MRLRIPILPRRVARILAIVALFLVVASFIANFIEYGLTEEDFPGDKLFVYLLSAQTEGNIPTWYSSSTLLLCSIILATIAAGKKLAGERFVPHWVGLSLIFLYISVDEASRIHELAVAPIRAAFDPRGFLYFAWVIPAMILVAVFVLAYLKFLAALPKETRRRFLIAGAIFVAGALGMELIGGAYLDQQGRPDLAYAMIASTEEFLEMLGVVVFIYALLSYMGSDMEEVQLIIDNTDPGRAAIEPLTHQSMQEDLS